MGTNDLQHEVILSEDQRRRLALALADGLTCSNHSLTAGGTRRHYVDMHTVVTNPENAKLILSLLSDQVARVRSVRQIDRLAFVDVSRRGPSGLLTCEAALAAATELPTVTIRPDKRLFVSQVIGALNRGDRLLFLCDVLTTGQTLARAVGVALRRQAQIEGAVFVYEGDSGRANLSAIGIDAATLQDRDGLRSFATTKLGAKEIAALDEPMQAAHDLLPTVAAQLYA